MTAKTTIKVFIPSGAGAPGFAGIVRCLRKDSRVEIFAGDTNPNPYGKVLANEQREINFEYIFWKRKTNSSIVKQFVFENTIVFRGANVGIKIQRYFGIAQ